MFLRQKEQRKSVLLAKTGTCSKKVPHVNTHALSEMFALSERLTIAMQLARDNYYQARHLTP